MREVIATEQAYKAIGPYSQAIRAQGLIFTSGQVPWRRFCAAPSSSRTWETLPP